MVGREFECFIEEWLLRATHTEARSSLIGRRNADIYGRVMTLRFGIAVAAVALAGCSAAGTVGGAPGASREAAPAVSCVPRNSDSYYRTGRSLIVDPNNASHLFVAVEYRGAYQSFDGGRTWQQTLAGFGWRNGCFPEPFKAMFDPNDSMVIYLSVNGDGIVKTSNGGTTWTKLYQPWMYNRSEDFEFDPQNSRILYASTEDVTGAPNPADNSPVTKGLVYKTVDGGSTWTELATGLTGGAGSNGIVVSRDNPGHILCFTLVVHFHPGGRQIDTSHQLGILETADGGNTWAAAHTLPAAYEATGFVANSTATTGNIFVTSFTAAGVPEQDYSTVDFARTWRRSDTVLSYVAYDPRDDRGLHMLGVNSQPQTNTANKLYESNDGGLTWQATINLPTEIAAASDHRTLISAIRWDPVDPNTIYASAASAYVWKSTNSGHTWQTLLNLTTLPQ